MLKSKQAKLVNAGWKVGTVAEFLDLTPDEIALVEIRLALADSLRKLRLKRGLTQTQVAEMLESSQSRVAKMEAADAAVSLDLLVRALLALGKTRRELGGLIAS